jgi:hypothetical protein
MGAICYNLQHRIALKTGTQSRLQGDIMIRILLFFSLLATFISGCSQNHFNVPTENFADKVRVMGVVPIIMDADSDIKHPQKDELIAVVTELNRKYENQLVRKLKATGNFYTIALMDGDPQGLFTKLSSRREKRDDASILYNKYFWKSEELRDYIQKNNLDAVMLLVVSGLTKSEKVISVGQMKSLSTDYNHLVMSAQILDATGAVLWEYPNFRQHILSYDPLINLEYPDFNEAEANLTTKAHVKFKTIEGIRRALELKRKDLLLRETQEPEEYTRQFDAMISLLKYDNDKERKSTPPPVVETSRPLQPTDQPTKAPEMKPAPAPVITPAPIPAPPAAALDAPTITRVPVLDKSNPPAVEIVPATGSTL